MEATFVRHMLERAILPIIMPITLLINAAYLAYPEYGLILNNPYPMAAPRTGGTIEREPVMHVCQATSSSGVNSTFYNCDYDTVRFEMIAITYL